MLLTALKGRKPDFFLRYVYPKKSPLELYPPSNVYPCTHIVSNAEDFQEDISKKCAGMALPSESGEWCRFSLNDQFRLTLEGYLLSNYNALFRYGKSRESIPIGPNSYSLYSHFNFIFSQNPKSLTKIEPSNPVNLSSSEIALTFNITVLDTSAESFIPMSLFRQWMAYLAITLVVFMLILRTPDISNDQKVISTIPQSSFLYAVLTGAGIGALSFIFVLITFELVQFQFQWKESWWYSMLLPSFVSSVLSSITTSILCHIWHVKDVASALYFAPLLLPAILLFLLFSVQWIPICCESCFTFPLGNVFTFIITVVFVKLPINLIVSLIVTKLIKIPSLSKTSTIPLRRLPFSRRILQTFTNIYSFVLLYKPTLSLITSFDSDIPIQPLTIFVLFIPLYIITACFIGITSLFCSDQNSWAKTAFRSAVSPTIVLFAVLMAHAFFIQKMNGTLQISLYSTLAGLVCICIAAISGAISLISCTVWIAWFGTPVKE